MNDVDIEPGTPTIATAVQALTDTIEQCGPDAFFDTVKMLNTYADTYAAQEQDSTWPEHDQEKAADQYAIIANVLDLLHAIVEETK
jgi:hypothetical protein